MACLGTKSVNNPSKSLNDLHLPVAAGPGPDADGGDTNLFTDKSREFGGHGFQHHGKGSGLLQSDGIIDELLSCFQRLALRLDTLRAGGWTGG